MIGGPRFDRVGNFRCVAGESVSAKLSIRGAGGQLLDLTGRTFLWRILNSAKESIAFTDQVAASGDTVRMPFAGTVTIDLHGLGMTHEIVEIVEGGSKVWVSGTFQASRGGDLVEGDTPAGDDGIVTDDRGVIVVSASGAPGISAAQQLYPEVLDEPTAVAFVALIQEMKARIAALEDAVPTAPVFSVPPSISPSSGTAGAVFTGNDGTIVNGAVSSRRWLLNGVATGATGQTYTSTAAGSLTYEVTASGLVSPNAVATSAAVTVAAAIPAPAFTAVPSISPSSGSAGQTFTATNGTVSNGTVTGRRWLLSGTAIGTGTTVVPVIAGTLVLENTALGTNGSTITSNSAPVTVAAAGGGSAVTSIDATGWSAQYTADPTGQVINVTRAGYDATGATTSYVKPRSFTRKVRGIFPNQLTDTASTVAMDDYVYSTDTIAGVTNNSTEISPKPIAAWVMPSRLLVGNSVHWEVVAFHRDARLGRMAACVRVRGNDGTTQTAWQTVATTAISTIAEDAQPIEAYVGDLDVTALATGLLWLEAEVFPWYGATASVLRSNDQTDDREFSKRYFTKNVALAAAPPLVYVSPTGNDSAGVCSTVAATAAASPFLTVQAAITGALAATAITGGKLDGVRVRIMSGNVVWGTFNSAINRNQSSASLVIERDPNSPRASCILQQAAATVIKFGYSGTNISSLASPLTEASLIIRDVTYQRTATGQISNSGTGVGLDVQIWNVSWDNGSFTGAWSASTGGIRFYGVTFTNLGTFFTYSTTCAQRLHRGVTATTAGTNFETWVQVGCKLTGHGGGTYRDATKGTIVYNSKFPAPSATSAPILVLAATAGDVITGVAIVQNVVETIHTTSATPAIRVSSDGANGSVVHAVILHNLVTGYGILGRSNLFYDESTGTNRRNHRLIRHDGDIPTQLNTKGDIFVGTSQSNPSEAPFRTGNFAYVHGVGCAGNWSMFAASAPTSEAQIYAGAGSVIGSSVTVRNDPLFVNYQGTTGAAGMPVAGTGGGDYHLQSGSAARAITPDQFLAFDLAGVARSTGAQPAGAYA